MLFVTAGLGFPMQFQVLLSQLEVEGQEEVTICKDEV